MNHIAATGSVARQRPHLCVPPVLFREQEPCGWHVPCTRNNCKRSVYDQLANEGYGVGISIKTEPATGLFILSVNSLRRSVAVEVNCANVVPA
ncbi:MAG TPA: hypothetical protein VGE69_04385 [Pseudomonadales bacterium]